MPRVAVVVLNWNGIEDTKECLSSLFTQTYDDFSIVVVDNASEDNSRTRLEDIKKGFPSLLLLYNDKNLGFAGGANTGMNYARKNGFELVALLNNDAVADKDWLKNLVSSYDNHPEAGIVTGLLLHRDGQTIDSTGDFYTTWGMPFPRSRNASRSTAPKSGYVFSASGGGSLYSVEMLGHVGYFDETFFAYYEDVDISFRAQLDGNKVYYEDSALAYHKQGASSSKVSGFTTFQALKNLPILLIKNVPLGLLPKILPRFTLAYTLMLWRAILSKNVFSALKGWLMSIYYFPHSLSARFKIQRSRKVSVQYIDDMLVHDMPPEQTGLRKFRKFFTGK